MPEPITARVLRKCARDARALNQTLDAAMQAKLMPLLVGFDLDYLADQFETAAEKMEMMTDA